MNKRAMLYVLFSGLFLSLVCSIADAAAPKQKMVFHKTPPDLTKGGKADDAHDWRLGPIGANGWVFIRSSRNGGSSLARQILVTGVDKNSPAAGKLLVDDVITGAYGKAFDRDARMELADAINEAEKIEKKGLLSLRVWRGGSEQDVAITLPVMGSYSATMPFNCPKTDKIVDQTCTYLKNKPLKGGWLDDLTALGLLSTGRDDLMPKLKEYAHSICLKEGEKLSIEKHVGMVCWGWAYKTMFLCEYYLRTNDKYVLPSITELATKIAMGQSGVGTWGHTYAAIENSGHMHGHLGGYGAINQIGLTLMIDLALAKKCGVTNDEIEAAITRGSKFFGYFIGRGTIPYGDHGAAHEWFDDNGKSGSAAIFFDLMGNREGAAFFPDLILGSAPNGREEGHCGCFWSHLWGGIGALRGGEIALQAFFDQMNWAFTLERQPDGRMVFQGNAGEGGEKGDQKTKYDPSGVRLLQLCAPRRILYITGKETPKTGHLTQARISQIIRAGKLDGDEQARAKLAIPEILQLLQDPIPAARSVGARTLAERNINCVSNLITMLDSKDRYTRYGAAEALCKAGFANRDAADKLIRLMEADSDITFQTYAMNALNNRDKTRGLLSVSAPAIPILLRMAVKHFPNDPRRILQSSISEVLFYKGNAQPRRGLLVEHGVKSVSRELLLPAIKEILTNDNGRARSNLAWVYNELTQDELKQMWGSVYRATRKIAPSGIMFASGIQVDGLKLMAKNRTQEGLESCVWYIRHQNGHGSGPRTPEILSILMTYGAHAKAYIPKLEEHAKYFEANGKTSTAQALAVREAIAKIKAIEGEPTDKLVSIAEYLKQD